MVNPYDTEELADAIRRGAGNAARRSGSSACSACAPIVREHNIYRWAGNLIGDLCGRQAGRRGDSPQHGATGGRPFARHRRDGMRKRHAPSFRVLAASRGAVAASRTIALFLDFDGTLAAFRPRPEDVRLTMSHPPGAQAAGAKPAFRSLGDQRAPPGRYSRPDSRSRRPYLGLHGWEGRATGAAEETRGVVAAPSESRSRRAARPISRGSGSKTRA